VGLAIYNSTILDIAFPPFLFRKLVAAAPQQKRTDPHLGLKPTWKPEISDLAQFDPVLAKSLQYILDYEGDLAEDIGATYEVISDRHGVYKKFYLGSNVDKVVDKYNRDEYVRLYLEYLLDRSVRKQFEAFARGFFNVCGGNALSLFHGEEIERLIRGSGDLNFSILRGSAVYENWKETEDGPEIREIEEVENIFPVVAWFWDLMDHAGPDDQKRVLRWITGSDRIPATGIASLVLKIQRLGDDSDRLPQSRTCYNMLQLWNYSSKRVFVNKFWYAVMQSGEGFALK
jgi:E3 ubiquitin-protein ligase HECTD2